MIPIVPGFDRLLFKQRPPFSLKVQQEGDQLRISWNPQAASGRARLDIFDGTEHTTVFVSGNMATATYAPRTADIDVRLGPIQEGAQPGLETVHYVRHVAPPVVVPQITPPPPPTSRNTRPRRAPSRPVQKPPSKVAYFFR